jgi:membrane-bound metal-dependent hydrolase YbcI (DUF457 family)
VTVPATPFHLPASALVAWPLRRHLDLPCLLLVNLAIDVEPAVASMLGAEPTHGLAHTLVGATLIGTGVGWLVARSTGLLERVLGGRYELRTRTAVLSGIVGGWLHVLLDAVMYGYLRPFFPLEANPLYLPGSSDLLHLLAALALLPVLALAVRQRAWRTTAERLTTALLALAALWMPLRVLGGL